MVIRELGNPEEVRALEPLFFEYFTLVTNRLFEASGIRVPMEVPMGNTMQRIDTYVPPKGHTFVWDENGRVLGMIILKHLGARQMEVKRLYLKPETRGQGLGRKLVRHCEAVARAEAVDLLLLDSITPLTEAIQLYENEGYTFRDAYPGSEIAEIPELADHCVYMEKRIG